MNAKAIIEQAREDFQGWGDHFVAGLDRAPTPEAAVKELVGRIERVEPDPNDFNSAAPYRQPSYANACEFLGIETKYNR